MPITLRVGERPNPDVSGFVSQVRGLPFLCYKVEAQVVDDDPEAPRRVWPPPSGSGSGSDEHDLSIWADVTGSVNMSGLYSLRAEGDLGEWIPSSGIVIGRIRYKVRTVENLWDSIVERPVEIVQGAAAWGIPEGGEINYCTLADLVIPLVQAGAWARFPWEEEEEPSDADKAAILALAQSRRYWRSLIERICRQRFRLVGECRQFQGEGGSTLFLPEPLFWGLVFLPGIASSVTEIAREIGEVEDPGNLFDLYSPIFNVRGATGPDRRNPAVDIVSNPSSGNLGPFSRLGPFASDWTFGAASTIWGFWGFVEEETQDCPIEIRTAATRGILLSNGYDLSVGGGGAPGPVRRERTDSHEIEWAVQTGSIRGGLLSILKDPAIRDALDLYRGPIGIAAGYGGL